MKCTLLRPMERRNTEFNVRDAQAAKLARLPYGVPFTIMAPAGTEIEDPQAWRLVCLGVARPADEECLAACNVALRKHGGFSEGLLSELALRYDKLNRGRATGEPAFDAPTETAESDDEE